jgi:SAM-dependent methyltransferase
LAPPTGNTSGLEAFFSTSYRLHNNARLAHLAGLGLPLAGKSVLDAGSGPGDHTAFYLHRQCTVVGLDARPECVELLKRRFPGLVAASVDLNIADDLDRFGQFDIVHCYGLLYHLERPAHALAVLSRVCRGLMLVETCVSAGKKPMLVRVHEDGSQSTQSLSGMGCRPARAWVFRELKKHFPFVCATRSQPSHPEFPLDWTKPLPTGRLSRAVFVASREPLDLPSLIGVLPEQQEAWPPS